MRCLVTGARSGIGSAIVRHLVAEGHEVIAIVRPGTSIDPPTLKTVVLQCDLADPAMIEGLTAQINERMDALDLLVHAAGLAELAAPDCISPHALHEQLAVNLAAPIQLTVGLRSLLRNSSAGCVIAFSSEQVRHPNTTNIAYGASKAGLEFAMLALAHALAKDGVRVNTLVLGGIDTPMLRQYLPVPAVPANLVGRAGTVEEVVKAVAFLMDNHYVTGASLGIDGGASVGSV
jgi:NAD(P)-dependent dehydrogenase (short-subunit alcohol dehydrogenase family)